MVRIRSFVLPWMLMLAATAAHTQVIRVATLNAWSGLTYEGLWTIRSFEDDETHARRLQVLIEGLRATSPDIIALQEMNPVGQQAGSIAHALGYDVISQRVLAGIKAGPVGIPCNLNEGLAILARPELGLEFIDVLPLSKDFGAFGNTLSFHMNEQNAALIGSVISETGEHVLVVNTHLPSYPEDTPGVLEQLRTVCRARGMQEEAISVWEKELIELNRKRNDMVRVLLETLDNRFPDLPLILLGDFNLTEASPGIASIVSRPDYFSVTSILPRSLPTWDGTSNPLTRFSADTAGAAIQRDPLRMIGLTLNSGQYALDHIFLRAPIDKKDLRDAQLILDETINGINASDHYGLMATIDLRQIKVTSHPFTSATDALPILSYDTDVGFGYGLKAFFLGHLGAHESFDIVGFNSTKGERWYRMVFSMPDFELRQGTIYPLAFDLTIDYDQYLKNVYFGIGPDSRFADKETYTREPLEIQALLARGVTRHTVVQGGARYQWIRNSNISDTSAILALPTAESAGAATAWSLKASVRHDTRNSYIDPSRGYVLQAGMEYAPPLGSVSYLSVSGTLQYYSTLMYPRTVFACRLIAQTVSGPELPIQFLLPLGGNKTLRGYPQDRFLGRTSIVSNAEVRFPIVWRFRAIVGLDAGDLWMSPKDISLSGWKSNLAVGLRFSMDTFIVRADLGFSDETTGFYLNFGHIF